MAVRTLLKQLRESPEPEALKQMATRHLRGILGNLVQQSRKVKLQAEQNHLNGTANVAPQSTAPAAYNGYPPPMVHPYQPPHMNVMAGPYPPYVGPYSGSQVPNALPQRPAGFIVPKPAPAPYQPGSNR